MLCLLTDILYNAYEQIGKHMRKRANDVSIHWTRSFCINIIVNNTRSISARAYEVQYCPSISYVTWTSASSIIRYSCKQRADITANWGHRKQLLNMMQFPECDLEDISCHSLLPPMFNHLPSCYVEWRTSAISSCCHGLPPGRSISDPTASGPQGALLQTWAQTLTIPH